MSELLWEPSLERIGQSTITKFAKFIEEKHSIKFSDYQKLHHFSVDQSDKFWTDLINYFEVKFSGNLVPANLNPHFDSYSWFQNCRFNFAENLLKKGKDQDVAINFVHESNLSKKITYGELRLEVASLAHYLKDFLNVGDVLGAFMPNTPETIVAMLATNSLGGTFTSTSSDFGIEGVYDRFSQSNPKIIIAASGYVYGGKYFDCTSKIIELEKRLPHVEKIIIVDFLNTGVDLSKFQKAVLYSEIIKTKSDLTFVELPFSHPLYIMYSSGTTGSPKCIVHGQGGTLLQHIKEHGLHTDVTANKKIFFFTTCGWMMWNWLVSSLYFGAEIILYEGSPAHPSPEYFFHIIDREKINIFGTSPKFLKALQDSAAKIHSSLNSLETILSTGSPLLPEQYDYVYKHIKSDVLLASISGGTDIIGCFMLGNPTLPVYRGEIQCLGLGMDVAALDEVGNFVIEKEGELVCKKSFPSRPIYFLNDPNNTKLNEAYFNQNSGLWTHGDFVKITKTGGVQVFGRSDATLNPGGVRIGTAEIYRQTESFDFILDSLCVGRPVDGDVEVILFVKMKNDQELNQERIKLIKDLIKKNTTPRHVPKEIFLVADIPYTRSGKKVEIAVARILAKKEITNVEAIANPECLAEFKKFVN
jgi:acetoacetyl-CoA synthetase